MKQAVNIIIVSIASFLAGLLVFLGIRKVNISKNKKYGLFVSALLIALSLAGCDMFSQKTKTKTIPQKFPLKQLESQTAQNEIEQFETEPSDRIVELNKFQEWKKFKTFWKKLDNIVPTKEESGSSNSDGFEYYGRYYGSLGFEEAENLQNQLDELVIDLRKIENDCIYPLEIDLLEKICNERINYMSNGFTSMSARMMPSRTLINRENSIKELENKIDILIDLQKSGKIDKEESLQAVANIRQDIKDFSIIDVIYTNYNFRFFYAGGFYSEDGSQDMAQKSIIDFEKHYNDYLKRKSEGQLEEFEEDYYKDLDEKYIETKKAIEKIKNILPNFDEIVDDLVL